METACFLKAPAGDVLFHRFSAGAQCFFLAERFLVTNASHFENKLCSSNRNQRFQPLKSALVDLEPKVCAKLNE